MKKIVSTLIISILMMVLAGTAAYAGTWLKDSNGWWYCNSDRTFPRNQWLKDTDGKYYYLNEKGYMLTNTITPDGRHVDATGAWLPTGGEQPPSNYATADQGQASNTSSGPWVWEEDHWRYRDSSGKYKNNEWYMDANGYKYHFDTFGNMDTGLKFIEGCWYHFSDEGYLYYNGYDAVTGTISTSEGKAYWPDESGLLLGQVISYNTESYDFLCLGVRNCRNVPITFEGYVDISGGGVNEKWYSVKEESDYIGEKVVINPMDTAVVVLMSPDCHALNFREVGSKVTAHYSINGKPYYVWTRPQPNTKDEYDIFYTHID